MALDRLRQIWADWRARWRAGDAADELEVAQDLGYGKQALRTILSRKRRNDLVRRREFDRLRQLRRRGQSAAEPPLTTALSFEPTALPDYPLEREETLQKIDAIEAQMARQWWRHAGGGRADTVADAIGRATPQSAALPSTLGRALAPSTQASSPSVTQATAWTSIASDTHAAEEGAPTLPPTLPPDFLPTEIGQDTRFLDPAAWADASTSGWGVAWQEAALQWAKAGHAAATRELLQQLARTTVAADGGFPHGAQALQDLARVEAAAQDLGVLRGDITALCEAQAQWQGRRRVLSCAGWLRLDFAAAGSLIHWVQAQQSEAAAVELREVHPLVAALLELLALDTQAQIVPLA